MSSSIYLNYRPLPSQRHFHRLRATFKGFSGPVGSGKTAALIMETIKLAFQNPGRTGLLAAPTYGMLRDVTVANLKERLEEYSIRYELVQSSGLIRIKDCESTILLRSLEQYEHLRGTNLAWFGVDELTYSSAEAWARLEARLRDPKATRREGFAVWTPKGRDWVYRKFIDNPTEHFRAVLARPFENTYLREAAPQYYETLQGSYSERFYRQEVLGEYEGEGEGRVYSEFDRNESVRAFEVDRTSPILWSLDFNVCPMSSVVAQRTATHLRVLDEISIDRSSTIEACREFKARYGMPEAGVVVYGDASGSNRRTAGATDYQIIREFWGELGYSKVSYKVPRANPEVSARVHAVNALFRNAANERRMWVHPRCKELIKDLLEVEYKTGTTIIDKVRDPRRTHLSDALGYLVWQEFIPKVAYGERNRPLF